MNTVAFLVVALAILGFGLVSKRVQDSPLTPPMVFAAFGLLVGPAGFNVVPFALEPELTHLVAEVALILILFTDACRIDASRLVKDHDLPLRLLGLGLPLMFVIGTAGALWLLPGLDFWEAAVLAAVLAPTDAALGQAVVTLPVLPLRIRQTINVESGLNDGIALPVFLLFLSLAAAEEGVGGAGHWAGFIAMQLVLGPLAGYAVGRFGGLLLDAATDRSMTSAPFQRLSALALALIAYSAADLVGGNGFIAAFCAGLTLGMAPGKLRDRLMDFSEAEGQLLTLIMFMVFGAVMIPKALPHISWQVAAYAAFSLFAARPLSAGVSLAGKGLALPTIGFLAWFGPRGIASILYVFLLLESRQLPGRATIYAAMAATVCGSIVLHGLSAQPLSRSYAAYASRRATGPEHDEVPEHPVRHGGA